MDELIGAIPGASRTEKSSHSRHSGLLRRLGRVQLPKTVYASYFWVAVLILLAVLGAVITPHDPLEQNLMSRNAPPLWLEGGSIDHPFGTDQLGYDLLSRAMVSARPTLLIGGLASVIALVTGTLLGLVAGYFRGPADGLIMLLADSQLSIPSLVIVISAVAAFGPSIPLLIILAGFSGWMGFARTVRANVLALRGRDFVVSSQALGAGNVRILYRHILPNIASTVIVLITIQFRSLILFEAALSFLGLGVPPPQPSWGSMISGGRDYLLSAWWISVLPGLALMLTVLSVSLIGDWLRDELDPTLRNIR